MYDTNEKDLNEAVHLYYEKYGRGQMDMFKLEECIREVKENKNKEEK